MTFEAGQTVYDRSGRVYQYQGMMDNRAIVCRIFDGAGWEGELEPYPSELAEQMDVASLSDTPPTAQIVELVLRAENELKRIKAEIAEATVEARNAEKQNADRLEKLKRFSALEQLEAFLDGEITHFATTAQYGGKIEVKTFDETMLCKDDYGRFNGEVKMLTLFGTKKSYPEHGNKNGDLLWKVNQYYDGSGSGWHIVQPCLSEDEAKAVAAQWLEDKWAEHRALEDRLKHSYWLKAYIESADKIGLPAPDDIIADFEASKKAAAEAAVQKAKDELAKAMAQTA
jgi:hypothetical protein